MRLTAPLCARVAAALFPLAAAAAPAVLENDVLRVELDSRFPRILRYELKKTRGVISGAAPASPNVVEINGTPFTELILTEPAPMRGERKYRLVAAFGAEEARYAFRAFETYGVIAFEVVFRLYADSVIMKLEKVSEQGQYRLHTLYFPKHDLLTVSAGEGNAAAFRAEFDRQGLAVPKSKPRGGGVGLIRWRRVYNGPVAGLSPDAEIEPTHWAMAAAGRVVGVLENNIPVFPIHTIASGASGKAARYSIWNAPFPYRINGEVVEPLVARIRLVDDLNRDGELNWEDGAIALRQRMPVWPEYKDAFIYKIFGARLPDSRFPETRANAPQPTVKTTFAQALDIIRKVHNLTSGRPQIVYLVGWQHNGHDDKWPDFSVVNPRLGGREGLLALMKEATRYNAAVSFHTNLDDAYRTSPAWDPETIARTPDGEIQKWQIFHDEQSYHTSHRKDVDKGGALRRVDELARQFPVRKSVHIDATRYTNESWEPDRFIDMTAEHQAFQRLVERYKQHGLSVTIESSLANPAYIGRVAGFGGRVNVPGSTYFWFLAHRRWVGGGAKSPEMAVFGSSRGGDVDAQTPAQEIVDRYYLENVVQQYLANFDALDYRDDGKRLAITYQDGVVASYDRPSDMLRIEKDGNAIAVGTARFLPIDDHNVLAYSKDGGKQRWNLPRAWSGRRLEIVALTETGREPGPQLDVAAGALVFEAIAGRPYLITARP